MMRIIVCVAAAIGLVATSASGIADDDLHLIPSDRYAGCIFGIAIPLMHHGLKMEKASAAAYKRCAPLSKGIDENELEGLSDYVNMILVSIESK